MPRKPRSLSTKAPKPPKRKKAPKKRRKPPSPAEYLKRLKSVSDDDFGFFGDPELASTVTTFFSTGSLAIDRLIGGGWPITRITELAAWEGIGKSTLLDQSIAQCQCAGGIAALIDSEHARDESYSVSLGVDPRKLIKKRINEVITLEAGFEACDQLLEVQAGIAQEMAPLPPPPMLIVWDSIGGTPTNAEIAAKASDKERADAAKVIKRNLRRLTQKVAVLNVALVFSNHFYSSVGGSFSYLSSYGGSGIKMFTSLRVWLSRGSNLELTWDGQKHVVGHEVEAKLKKTRIVKPRPPAKCGLIYGAGFDNAYTLFDWGINHGVAEGHEWIRRGGGGWSYLMLPDGEHIAFKKQFVGLGEVFAQHPEWYQKMAAQYLQEG